MLHSQVEQEQGEEAVCRPSAGSKPGATLVSTLELSTAPRVRAGENGWQPHQLHLEQPKIQTFNFAERELSAETAFFASQSETEDQTHQAILEY